MLENVLQKQKVMRRVLLSLLPIFLFAGYLYGFRLLILAAVVFPAGFLCEFLFEKFTRKKNATEAVFVTCSLYLLSLPPDLPWWIALIGIVFAVMVGKEIFGGFGRNIFNPAIAGRLFIYITFPAFMTEGWISAGNFGIDAVTLATPLHELRMGSGIDLIPMITGIRPGSFGESQIILILLAGIYLIATKSASWITMLSTILSGILLTFVLDLLNVPVAQGTLPALLSGSFLFVAVFMATDPVTSPKKPLAQMLFGIIVGGTTVLIRSFSLFTEGTGFGVFLGNTFASLLDEITGKRKKK
ncbi:MAG: RnfABCDGE type electron transport complex subunit D [Spirochaetales bacterium]|nr:RnfABCDGE type electron transport complex subunit D [Spirochaetales bacterium]